MTEETNREELRLERQIESLNNQLEQLRDDSDSWVQSKISELTNAIEKLPDRNPTRTGTITMKQHLANLKQSYMEKPQVHVDKEIAKIERRISELEEEIENE